MAYIGSGSPRFYLPLDIQLAHRGFGQFVILTNTLAAREALRSDLLKLFEQDFPELRASVLRLENGPPVGFPVQFRVSGANIDQIRDIARQVANIMRGNPNLINVQLNWEEPSKVVQVNVDQAKLRLLGINPIDVAAATNERDCSSPRIALTLCIKNVSGETIGLRVAMKLTGFATDAA